MKSGGATELVCPTLSTAGQSHQLCSHKQFESTGRVVIPVGKVRSTTGCLVTVRKESTRAHETAVVPDSGAAEAGVRREALKYTERST